MPSFRACPTTATRPWPSAARKGNAHYFDLTEDVEVTRAVRRHRARCIEGVRAAVRTRARLHQHRRQRAHHALRRAAHRQAARRRPAPAPEQRAQVLADLVHRGPHQRIRQSVRGDRRRHARRAAPLEGLEEIEIDGTLYEAFNTSGGLGSLGETYGKHVRADELQDHALSGALRADAPAHERSQAQSRSRDAEARARECRAADAAGRRHRLCRGRAASRTASCARKTTSTRSIRR